MFVLLSGMIFFLYYRYRKRVKIHNNYRTIDEDNDDNEDNEDNGIQLDDIKLNDIELGNGLDVGLGDGLDVGLDIGLGDGNNV